jgi:quercetin dioxygenase-like cupin family protein
MMLSAASRFISNGIGVVTRRPGRASERLACAIHRVQLPLAANADTGFSYYPQYRGSMRTVASLSCHVSSLAQGCSPHPPHTHAEEEILIMLQGEADIVLPAQPAGQRERKLRAGEFVYYPADFPHTLRAVSAEPANYLMFKWRGARRALRDRLGFQHIDLKTVEPGRGRQGLDARVLFEGATGYLGTLHAHLSFLAPGAGYAPHIDAHDGAIVLLQGEVETLDQRVRSHGIIHFASGQPHGMRNPGAGPASYLVFEFHAREPLWRKLVDAERWRRKLRAAWRRR